ncbi:hypothetical protein [Methanoplanus endosymbiosus]|uniref:Uncharacterized protein n=1 Tax=Methanoplanus endosymbiosus TaxID=33865 RepID=A0A9E7THU3_9EURY|nr:hypothetical protein [Methanoplanus endosymbiosus]UUX93597.1 hypothetical protein L6E24_05625 [Methanoplanus endosymbiosus]
MRSECCMLSEEGMRYDLTAASCVWSEISCFGRIFSVRGVQDLRRLIRRPDDCAVSTMIEYLNITTVMVVMLVVVFFAANTIFIEKPSNTIKYSSFVDIGNGMSVRIVDLYAIAPETGRVVTSFNIPDDVAGKEYYLRLDPLATGAGQRIIVTDGYITTRISISGIGATKGVTGNTTGTGENVITYDSGGF